MDGTNVTFDSVFADATDVEKEFDNMFGAEEDNRLLDAVEESSASELPDDAELHQTDDDATPKDIADELGENHDTDNAPDTDSADAEDLVDMASGEADKSNIEDDKTGVEDQVKGGDPDVENLEDEADKAINKKFDEAYASLQEELQEGENPIEGDPGDTIDDVEEGCKKKPVNEEDCDPSDPSCIDDLEDPIEDEEDDEDDDDDEDEEDSVDDVEEGCKKKVSEGCKKKPINEEDCDPSDPSCIDDLEDPIEEDPAEEKSDDVEEGYKKKCGESATLPEESIVDQIEDKIIDDVENGNNDISGKELSDLEDMDDDDIIDMVEGK